MGSRKTASKIPLAVSGCLGRPLEQLFRALLFSSSRSRGLWCLGGALEGGRGRNRALGPRFLHGPGPRSSPPAPAGALPLVLVLPLCLFFRSVDYDSGEILLWACFGPKEGPALCTQHSALCTSSSSLLVSFCCARRCCGPPTFARQNARTRRFSLLAEFRLVRALRRSLPILW